MNNLAVFDYNGQAISRRQNGFINLTQMCQANGKRLDVFMKAQKTKEYIDRKNWDTSPVLLGRLFIDS